MTLLAPWALWLSPVGAAVVALYLLKIKRQRTHVPAIELWRRLAGQHQVRTLFQQLKRWLSLLLWLIIVLCLLLSLGNPVLTLGTVKPRSIAVIIDNSASMQTLEADGRTRLDHARDALQTLTTGRPIRDQWMLIEAGRDVEVRQAWTRHRRTVRDAGERITPFYGACDLSSAVDLARQLLAGQPRPCIVVLSDGNGGQVSDLLSAEDLTYWPIGTVSDNLGITWLHARPQRQQSVHYAYMRMFNASDQRIETQVVLELDGVTVAVEPVAVDARQDWEHTTRIEAPDGGVLRVWIDRADSLPADNEAFAILDPIRAAAVTLVSPPEERFFFERALEAMPPLVDLGRSHSIDPARYERRSTDAELPDLTIVNNCSPRWPSTGTLICVNAWPDDLPLRQIGVLEQPRLLLAADAHPLTQYLSVGAAALTQARRIDATGPHTVLAHTPAGDPLILLYREAGRQVLCLAFDVMQSDLPFRNAFPILLRNAVSYLIAEQDKWLDHHYPIGTAIAPLRPLPADVSEVIVSSARNEQRRLPVSNGRFQFDHTDTPDALRFEIGDHLAYTAVNITDERETNSWPLTAPQDPAQRLALSAPLFGMLPWVLLGALATMLVSLEWLTYHLRWTE